eukprot:PhM_4_TR9428/c0_g1_i1/m.67293/K18213/PRORP; proteinaceous RNase P
MSSNIELVVKSALKGKNVSVALDALQTILASRNKTNKQQISDASLGALLHVCAAHGTREDVRSVSDLIMTAQQHDFGFGEASFGKVLSILCASGRMAHALQILKARPIKQLRRRDFTPFLDSSTSDLTSMYCARAYAHQCGVQLWDSDYTNILHMLLRGDQGADAVDDLLSEMQEGVPVVSTEFGDTLSGSTDWCSPTRIVDGVCSVCRAKLDLFPFTDGLREQLLQDIRALPLFRDSARPAFEGFLEHLRSEHIDVIVDGANIGYCGLYRHDEGGNPALPPRGMDAVVSPNLLTLNSSAFGGKHGGGHNPQDHDPTRFPVRFEHIEAVVHQLRLRQLRPAIFLHERHVDRRRLWKKYHHLVETWRRENILFPTPSGVNDDVCWLYAAVFHTTPTRPTFVVTNDLMRDHHYNLLSQRSFTRWRDTCRVTYKIYPPGTMAQLTFPSVHSTRMQFAQKSARWHVPVLKPGLSLPKPGHEAVASSPPGDSDVVWSCVKLD